MNIIIYEDNNTEYFKPFSINHASFELKCGVYSNLDRILNLFEQDINCYLVVREEIKNLIQERYPRYTVNPKSITSSIISGILPIANECES